MRSERKKENCLRYSNFFSKIYTQQGWVRIIIQKGTEIISCPVLASFHFLLNLLKNCFGLFCFKHQRRCFLYAHLGYFQPSKYSEIQAIVFQNILKYKPYKTGHSLITLINPHTTKSLPYCLQVTDCKKWVLTLKRLWQRTGLKKIEPDVEKEKVNFLPINFWGTEF